MGKDEPWFRVIGTEGEIVIAADFERGGMTLYNGTHPDGAPPPGGLVACLSGGGSGGSGAAMRAQATAHCGFLGSFSCQWEEICGCAEAGLSESAVSPPAEALEDILVVEALYRSVRSGRWEAVTAPDDDYSRSSLLIAPMLRVPAAILGYALLCVAARRTRAPS
jgi:hypothetical protein